MRHKRNLWSDSCQIQHESRQGAFCLKAKKRRGATDKSNPIRIRVLFICVFLLWEKAMREMITNSLYGKSLLPTTWITQLNF